MSFAPQRNRPSLLPGGLGLRLVAMVGALCLIGATIHTLRNQYLASREAERVAGKDAATDIDRKTPWTETIIPGPSDDDPTEREDMRRFLEVVTDKHPVESVDSPAYFRMLKWAMSQPISELEARANREVTFGKLVQYPNLHRAELIRLRMKVARIIRDSGKEVVDNSLGLTELYEVYAETDDSMGYPLVVVVPELPPGIRVGIETKGDIVFVGYFLKIFGYEAFQGKPRAAPMLVGRLRVLNAPGGQPGSKRSTGLTAMLIGGCVIVGVVMLTISMYRMTRGRRRAPLSFSTLAPHSTVDVESWLEHGTIVDPDSVPTAAERLSPAGATNGQSHHPDGESTLDPGSHSG